MKPAILTALLCISLFANALNPSRTYKQRPEKFNLVYKESLVKTLDQKAFLLVWNFEPRIKSKKVILLAHNGEGNMADYLRRVDQFLALGYRVISFDYRGYGESSEYEVSEDLYIDSGFQDDMETMISHCSETYAKTLDIYGWGVGAGLALGIGYHRDEVTRIIADTPFLSMDDVEHKFKDHNQWLELPHDEFLKKNEPITALLQAPRENMKGILIIVGNHDPLFEPSDMEKLRSLRKELIAKVYVVDNPKGMDNFRANKEKYFNRIITFLDNTP